MIRAPHRYVRGGIHGLPADRTRFRVRGGRHGFAGLSVRRTRLTSDPIEVIAMTRRIPSACTLLFSVLLLLCGAIPLTRSNAVADESSEANYDVQLNRMQVDDPGAKAPGDDDQPTI